MKGEKRSAKAKRYELKSWREFPLMNVSLGTMLHNLTGSWRFIKPIYEDKTPPCQNACPCGNDIEAWIRLLQADKVDRAYLHLKREEPFPAVLGRVCFRFCEDQCNRAGLDESISIRELERYVGDKGLEADIQPEVPSYHNKSLGVVGSGPSGMSAAYFARLLGFHVTVYEAYDVLGGLLRTGIPHYRLPNRIVEAEFELLKKMGIEFREGIRIGKEIPFERLCQEHDYVFLGPGAHKCRVLGIENEEAGPQIMPGLEFLKKVALGFAPDVGRRVTIVGGGNTAVDAARTALRLGAHEVTVIYRRSEAEMPAHPEEVREAREEGVKFRFLASPEKIELRGKDTIELLCTEMELGPIDESGRRKPVKKKGSVFTVHTDTMIVAIGETASFPPLNELLDYKGGPLDVSEELFVIMPFEGGAKVYAGGDLINIPHTVVHAVASGKRAAVAIDCDRRGANFDEVLSEISIGEGQGLSFSRYVGLGPLNPVRQDPRKVVKKENIVYDYFDKASRVSVPVRKPHERTKDFEPILGTMDKVQAVSECNRCIHCGRCIECDNCLVFCPDVSILPADTGSFGYVIDYDYCKGCGICFTECPRFAISMVDEEVDVKEV